MSDILQTHDKKLSCIECGESSSHMWWAFVSYVVSARVIWGEHASKYPWRRSPASAAGYVLQFLRVGGGLRSPRQAMCCSSCVSAEVSGLCGKLCILAMSGAGRPLSQSIFQLISVKGVKKFPFGFVRSHKNSIFAENFWHKSIRLTRRCRFSRARHPYVPAVAIGEAVIPWPAFGSTTLCA